MDMMKEKITACFSYISLYVGILLCLLIIYFLYGKLFLLLTMDRPEGFIIIFNLVILTITTLSVTVLLLSLIYMSIKQIISILKSFK